MIKMEQRFIKVRSIKDIVKFTSLITIGLVFTVIPEVVEAHLAGYALISIGAVLTFFLKSGFKDIETQEIYFKREFLFSGNMKTSILSAIASSPESIDISQEDKGQELILQMYYGKTSGKAYLQLFEFVPHQYVPCSEVYEYEISKIANLLK